MVLAHQVPAGLIDFLEMQVLAVGAVRHDHRVVAVIVGAVDVGAQHQPVIHDNGHVPVDTHAFAHFGPEQGVVEGSDFVHGGSPPEDRFWSGAVRRTVDAGGQHSMPGNRT